MSAPATPHRFLICHWEGGGNTPPILGLARRLLARGHAVRVLADACNQAEVERTGAEFACWQRLPPMVDKSPDHDRYRDWEAGSPLAGVVRVCERLMYGASSAYAQDTRDAIAAWNPDTVVATDFLYGAMAAAEAARLPFAAVAPNVYCYPRPGVPPFGPGFLPATGLFGHLRDRFVGTMSRRLFAKHLPALNATRSTFGLPPLAGPFDQALRADRILVQTATAFDFAGDALPANVRYVGPHLDDPEWVESRAAAPGSRPTVLVSFSTTFQDQAAALQRVIDALATLPVDAIVTSGPSVNPDWLRAPPNVTVVRSAPHAQILRHASLAVTHAGHGTVIRALAAGVPLLCLPMGRDQDDNAARVVARGAGLRLPPTAATAAIRTALERLLAEASFTTKAKHLGEAIRAEAAASSAISELESLATAKLRDAA